MTGGVNGPMLPRCDVSRDGRQPMVYRDLVVLVAEADYIVAMEAERLITSEFGCSVILALPGGLAETEGSPGGPCDVAVIGIGTDFEAVRGFAERCRRQGAILVFTTAFDPFIRGIAGYA